MSDVQRGIVQALAEGARERLKAGRRGTVGWARRVAPAAVLLRLIVALALFLAAELAVPPDWAAAGFYIAAAALFALAAALLPGGIAPLLAILFVLAAWVFSSALEPTGGEDGDPSLWTAAALACLLYTAHATAAVTQRLRTTTAVDGEIMLTWARHLGLVLASTVGTALTLALFTAYFTGLTAGIAIAAGIVAAVTVIYVLARSLHKNP